MSIIRPLSEWALGDEIVVGFSVGSHSIESYDSHKGVVVSQQATIIAIDPVQYVCLGWRQEPRCLCWPIYEGFRLEMLSEGCKALDTNEFRFGYWVPHGIRAVLAEPALLAPDQVCSGCGLSAPHKPAGNDGKFVCSPCLVMLSLGI